MPKMWNKKLDNYFQPYLIQGFVLQKITISVVGKKEVKEEKEVVDRKKEDTRRFVVYA